MPVARRIRNRNREGADAVTRNHRVVTARGLHATDAMEGHDGVARDLKGHLRPSLVTIRSAFPATNAAATIHFHNCIANVTRIQYKKWCREDIGIERGHVGYDSSGRYVMLEDKDIDKVRPESTRVINLSQFTDADAIDPVLYDEPLSRWMKGGGRALAVMRCARGQGRDRDGRLHGASGRRDRAADGG
jgi:hypothetical protein